MSKEKRRVPKLRFPGFTEDWEQRKFKDIAFKRGKISEADLPYIEFEDINSGIGTLNKNILQKVGHKKGILFEAGDVLFGKLRPYLQNWLLCQFMGIAVGDFWVFQPQIVSSAFLYYLIQSEAYQSVANISSGTKMPRSSWLLVSETQFSIPKYKEATMIGEFFTSIDKNITLHQRKLDNLKLKKKALLQKLFPKNGDRYPELRFPGFTDAWEQRKLGDIATFSKGNGYSESDLASFGDPIILYGRLYTNYETTISNIDTFVELKDKSVISQGGEVIVPASGETAEDISRASVVKKQGIIIGGDLNVIKANHLLDPTFLALTISNGEQQKELSKRAQGKSVVHLHNSDLQEVNLTFPVLNEQKKISTLFEKMDNIITLHQRKLDHLQLQKKALLQQMRHIRSLSKMQV